MVSLLRGKRGRAQTNVAGDEMALLHPSLAAPSALRRRSKHGAPAIARKRVDRAVYQPNKEACSGTEGLLRGLLPGRGCCPKIRAELNSISPWTIPGTSEVS
jgi:hypothetical protein